jgi:hypothetical protein
VRGAGNPIFQGTEIYIDGAQSSGAAGDSGFGERGGPSGAQRMIFGYGGHIDYVDSSAKLP